MLKLIILCGLFLNLGMAQESIDEKIDSMEQRLAELIKEKQQNNCRLVARWRSYHVNRCPRGSYVAEVTSLPGSEDLRLVCEELTVACR